MHASMWRYRQASCCMCLPVCVCRILMGSSAAFGMGCCILYKEGYRGGMREASRAGLTPLTRPWAGNLYVPSQHAPSALAIIPGGVPWPGPRKSILSPLSTDSPWVFQHPSTLTPPLVPQSILPQCSRARWMSLCCNTPQGSWQSHVQPQAKQLENYLTLLI